MKLVSHTKTGNEGSVTVSDALFGAPVNQTLLAQAVRVYRANARQGTAKVKTRSEVARTKKKWYKQKGTGNARHGARSAHIFVGGGVAHGPDGTQNWSLSLSQRMKHKALISALSAQVEQSSVCDAVTELSGKTKEAVALFESMGLADQRILVIVHEQVEELRRATQNLQNVFVTTAYRTNAFEVAQANHIVFTSEAISALENRVADKKQSAPKSTAPKASKIDAAEKTSEKKATKKTSTKAEPKKAAPKKVATKKPATKTAAKPKKTEKTEK